MLEQRIKERWEVEVTEMLKFKREEQLQEYSRYGYFELWEKMYTYCRGRFDMINSLQQQDCSRLTAAEWSESALTKLLTDLRKK